MLSGPCPQQVVHQGACPGINFANFLGRTNHASKIFQSCKKVPKEVPVARQVCNKEPVQVKNSLKSESQNIKYKHFRAATRCPKRFQFPRRSAPRSLSRSQISVCVNIFSNAHISELLPGAHQGLQECGCERAQDCGQAGLQTLRSEQRHDQVCKIFPEQIYFF